MVSFVLFIVPSFSLVEHEKRPSVVKVGVVVDICKVMVANVARVSNTLHPRDRLPGVSHPVARRQHLLDIRDHRLASYLRLPLGHRHERGVLGSAGCWWEWFHPVITHVHDRGTG